MNESEQQPTEDIIDNIDDIENFRARLNDKRITEFVQTLLSEDLNASRHNLITLTAQAIQHLCQTEAEFLKETLTEGQDNICPGCLMQNQRDLTTINNIADLFNIYLTNDEHPICG